MLSLRQAHLALERDHLDMVLLGKIAAGIHTSDTTVKSCKKEQKEREHTRMDFRHEGFQMCHDTFMFIHGVFRDKLQNLLKHYRENGVTPRVHGNTKRLPKNTLSFECVKRIVDFIVNYAECHAMLLPGRIPGYKRSDLKLLPSSTTKTDVWRK